MKDERLTASKMMRDKLLLSMALVGVMADKGISWAALSRMTGLSRYQVRTAFLPAKSVTI